MTNLDFLCNPLLCSCSLSSRFKQTFQSSQRAKELVNTQIESCFSSLAFVTILRKFVVSFWSFIPPSHPLHRSSSHWYFICPYGNPILIQRVTFFSCASWLLLLLATTLAGFALNKKSKTDITKQSSPPYSPALLPMVTQF